MSDNRTCKNYFADGGDTLVIGGTLTIENGATVEGTVSAAVVDSLVSTSATSALSAKQGKVLNDKIVALGPVDNLTSTDATKALSANQGKALKDAADAKVAVNQTDSTAADVPGVVADLNALLAKLIAAGLMAAGE